MLTGQTLEITVKENMCDHNVLYQLLGEIIKMAPACQEQLNALTRIVGNGNNILKLPCLLILCVTEINNRDTISGRKYLKQASEILEHLRLNLNDKEILLPYASTIGIIKLYLFEDEKSEILAFVNLWIEEAKKTVSTDYSGIAVPYVQFHLLKIQILLTTQAGSETFAIIDEMNKIEGMHTQVTFNVKNLVDTKAKDVYITLEEWDRGI